jgi:hypothetical protein
MSSGGENSCDEDLQFARDMQLAYELQAKEDKKGQRRRKKEEKHNSTLEDGFSPSKLNADHMLFVSCIVEGSQQVHLLVDTGASASAMSTNMMFQLGLQTKMNEDIVGAAKGVGSSNIVGVVENVECIIGQVEFRLFFMILEGQASCQMIVQFDATDIVCSCCVFISDALCDFGSRPNATLQVPSRLG